MKIKSMDICTGCDYLDSNKYGFYCQLLRPEDCDHNPDQGYEKQEKTNPSQKPVKAEKVKNC